MVAVLLHGEKLRLKKMVGVILGKFYLIHRSFAFKLGRPHFK